MTSVFVAEFTIDGLEEVIREALDWIQWHQIIAPDARVFIKPNFTYPSHRPGVTTSPSVIEGLVSVLRERTSHITIGESDGGAHAWRAEEAFNGHDIPRICHEYGVQAVNLSEAPCEEARTTVNGSEVRVILPTMLLHDTDVFITMPVPKVHVMTGVSLGFKNQWGCIPDVKRLRYHPQFAQTVLGINKLLRTRIAFLDGTYFLDHTGPMEGDPVAMNLIVMSDDPGAGSLACCDIMQVDPKRINHLRLAMKAEMMPADLSQVRLNQPLDGFKKHRFTVQRSRLHWITLIVFRNRVLTRLAYDSHFAKGIHDLLYVIRGAPKDITPRW